MASDESLLIGASKKLEASDEETDLKEKIDQVLEKMTIFEKRKKAKNLKDIKNAREIVHEIRSFGVNNFQICQIIKMLSYELEMREDMNSVLETINEIIEKRDYEL